MVLAEKDGCGLMVPVLHPPGRGRDGWAMALTSLGRVALRHRPFPRPFLQGEKIF